MVPIITCVKLLFPPVMMFRWNEIYKYFPHISVNTNTKRWLVTLMEDIKPIDLWMIWNADQEEVDYFFRLNNSSLRGSQKFDPFPHLWTIKPHLTSVNVGKVVDVRELWNQFTVILIQLSAYDVMGWLFFSDRFSKRRKVRCGSILQLLRKFQSHIGC